MERYTKEPKRKNLRYEQLSAAGVNKPWMNESNRETAARSVYGYLENDSVCGHIRSDIVGAKVDEVISRYGTGANSKMVAEIVRLHFQTREGTQNDR